MLSTRQRLALSAIAEAALPAGRYIPAAGEATLERAQQFLSAHPKVFGGYRALLSAIDAAAWLGHRRGFAALPPDARLEILQKWRHGGVARRNALRALITPLKLAHFDNPALYRQLGCAYEFERPKAEARPAHMRQRVHDGTGISADQELDCDVVVVGTGAGGAVVGKELAEQGVAVILVEEGRFFDRSHFTGRPLQMQELLYRDSGATFAIGNTFIPIPVGRGVGGTTLVNSGTCYRTPQHVLTHWSDELGLAELRPEAMAGYFERVEANLQVAAARPEFLGGNARVIARGCEALGLRQHRPLRRNAPDCDGKGVCCFGCPTDAKRSTNVSYVPLALRAGAELYTQARATELIREGGRAVGVIARTDGGATLTIRARAVVVAAGALHTPRLLHQWGAGRTSGQLGRNLSIHPATGLLAEFDERIDGWNGIPQGYAIEDLHDEGILFEGAATPLEMTMSQLHAIGPDLTRLAESFDRVATFGFLIEDTSRGRVFARDAAIGYWLGGADVARIKRGIDTLARVFFAAGAKAVWTPVAGFETLHSERDLSSLRAASIRASDLDLSAYHPLGTARIGSASSHAVCDAEHQVYDTPGLYVVDGAAVPSAVGVNPQVTIMAMATRAADRLAARLS